MVKLSYIKEMMDCPLPIISLNQLKHFLVKNRLILEGSSLVATKKIILASLH